MDIARRADGRDGARRKSSLFLRARAWLEWLGAPANRPALGRLDRFVAGMPPDEAGQRAALAHLLGRDEERRAPEVRPTPRQEGARETAHDGSALDHQPWRAVVATREVELVERQFAVDEARGMHLFERERRLTQHRERALSGQATARIEDGREVVALDEPRQYEGQLCLLVDAGVDDLDEVLARDARRAGQCACDTCFELIEVTECTRPDTKHLEGTPPLRAHLLHVVASARPRRRDTAEHAVVTGEQPPPLEQRRTGPPGIPRRIHGTNSGVSMWLAPPGVMEHRMIRRRPRRP